MVKIKGNTFVIELGYMDLGLYKLNEKDVILIDTGLRKSVESKIIPLFKEKGLNLSGIFCTHGHIDHAGGNSLLKEVYNPKIVIPYTENILCENSYNFYNIANNQVYGALERSLPDYSYKTDIVLAEGQTELDFGGHLFRVVSTPGHSPYHTAFITPDNVAYLGDALLGEQTLSRGKLPYVFDLDADLSTKENLKGMTCERYILSHEGVHKDIGSLIDKNREEFQKKAELLLRFLEEPKTFEQLMEEILKRLEIKASIRNYSYLQETAGSFLGSLLRSHRVEVFMKEKSLFFRTGI